MKITSFNGSPRGKKGNTNVMIEGFLEGALEAGATVESIHLVEKKVGFCSGCFTCWVKTPGKCHQDDDQADLIGKYLASDIVIFASPVYVDNVTGIMKDFFDRMIPIIDPHFTVDEHGETVHLLRYEKTPKVVIISNAGFPEQSHFQVLRLLYRRMIRNMRTEIIAEIYRGGGGLLQANIPQVADIIADYKKLLRKAGGEVVTDGKLSDESMKALERPLFSVEEYIAGGNAGWDAQLAQIEKQGHN